MHRQSSRTPSYCPEGFKGRYVVSSGDSLYVISQMFRVSLSSLIKANPHITVPTLIMPGDVICVPSLIPIPCCIELEKKAKLPFGTGAVAYANFGPRGGQSIGVMATLPLPNYYGNYNIYIATAFLKDIGGFGNELFPTIENPPTYASRIELPTAFSLTPEVSIAIQPSNSFSGISGPIILENTLEHCSCKEACTRELAAPLPTPTPSVTAVTPATSSLTAQSTTGASGATSTPFVLGSLDTALVPTDAGFSLAPAGFGDSVGISGASTDTSLTGSISTPDSHSDIDLSEIPNLDQDIGEKGNLHVFLKGSSKNPNSIGFGNIDFKPAKVALVAAALPSPKKLGACYGTYKAWIINSKKRLRLRINMHKVAPGLWFANSEGGSLEGFDQVVITAEPSPGPIYPIGPVVLSGSLYSC